MGIERQAAIARGVVSKIEDQRYSSSHVSGSSNGYGAQVSTTVRHHQVQKLWVTHDSGREDSYQFSDTNLDVHEGHQVSMIGGSATRDIYRFVNRSTGYYWRIKGKQRPGMMGRLFARLFAAILAIFAAMPGLNIFSSLLKLGVGFGKKDFVFKGLQLKVLALLFTALMALYYAPALKLVDNNLIANKITWTFSADTLESISIITARFGTTSLGSKLFDGQWSVPGRPSARMVDFFHEMLRDHEAMSTEAFRAKYKVHDERVTLADFSKGGKRAFEDAMVGWMLLFSLPLFLVGLVFNQVALGVEYRISSELDALSRKELSR